MSATDLGRRVNCRDQRTKKALKALRNKFQDLVQNGFNQEELIRYLTAGGPLPTSSTDPEPEPAPPAQAEVGVKSVCLEVAANTAAHHTDEFEVLKVPDPALIVRRGQPFSLTLLLSAAFNPKTHDLRLIFEIGDNPSETKNTKAAFLLSDKCKGGKWGAKLVKNLKESLQINVFTPPDCIVGKWRLTVELMKKEQPVSTHSLKKPIYILFNPWCKDDAVYMENEEELAEYVLADSGCIYYGAYCWQEERAWTYGQFSGNVLDCSLYLLDTSDLYLHAHGDPVRVVRKLSAMVNCLDDDGVLVGNWGDATDGTKPTQWTGSTKILEEYYSTKTPVKYGQCWVFSGVLTTLCRALGIPCRSITNYVSAHDTDASTTIDIHYDEKMNMLDDYRFRDSVWNYHCWNDVWMRRADLEGAYGGWQAVDATPQEASEDVYRCGPCPLRAIREGSLDVPFDATFIFAEVNGDRVNWKREPDGTFKPKSIETHFIGQKISTRALKSVIDARPAGDRMRNRQLITDQYKFPEGSAEERAAVMKAYRLARRPSHREAYDIGPTDVDFEMKFRCDSELGQDFVVQLLCQNKSNEDRTLRGYGSFWTMYYTGVLADRVTCQEFKDIKLQAGASKSVEVTVKPEQYCCHLKDGCHVTFTFAATVGETQQSFVKNDAAVMVKPKLQIKAPDKGKVDEEFEVTVTFSNPLSWTLTDCSLEVEGPGIIKATEYKQNDVCQKGTFLAKLKLKPKKKGERNLTFVFSSRELDNITGGHKIDVEG